jgi:hypothetical protein
LISYIKERRILVVQLTGQRHRLKQQAKEKLERAGWIDEFRILCRQHAATTFQDDPKTLTHESLVAEVGAKGKASIPDYLKAELLSEIKSILEQNTSVSPAQQSS